MIQVVELNMYYVVMQIAHYSIDGRAKRQEELIKSIQNQIESTPMDNVLYVQIHHGAFMHLTQFCQCTKHSIVKYKIGERIC